MTTGASAGGGEEPPPDESLRRFEEWLNSLTGSAVVQGDEEEPEPEKPTAVAGMEDVQKEDALQDIELKRLYAKGALGLLLVQLVVSNGVFIAYAWVGRDWNVPDQVMIAFLAATVVQIIGVVLVIAKYLFPNRSAP